MSPHHLFLPVWLLGVAAPHIGDLGNPVAPAYAEDHSLRLSITDLSFQEDHITLSVRMFWDDLQFGVMEHTSDMEFQLADEEVVHDLVTDYINAMLELQVDGEKVIGVRTQTGIQEARIPDEVMWWYELSYPTDGQVGELFLRNRLLFNMFEDQRNLLHLTLPDGKERAYYFSWAEESVRIPIP